MHLGGRRGYQCRAVASAGRRRAPENILQDPGEIPAREKPFDSTNSHQRVFAICAAKQQRCCRSRITPTRRSGPVRRLLPYRHRRVPAAAQQDHQVPHYDDFGEGEDDFAGRPADPDSVEPPGELSTKLRDQRDPERVQLHAEAGQWAVGDPPPYRRPALGL